VKVLNNATTTDAYGANVLEAPRFVRLVLIVTGATVLVQLGHGFPPSYDTPEAFYAPGVVYTLERDCSGVRVRSAVKGVPAQVSLQAAEPFDVGGAGG
jgi:hypothetical protein